MLLSKVDKSKLLEQYNSMIIFACYTITQKNEQQVIKFFTYYSIAEAYCIEKCWKYKNGLQIKKVFVKKKDPQPIKRDK